jgi:hypothetical protein
VANLFHHQAQNDLVRIENGAQCYIDHVAAFAADNGTPVPALPAGAVERIYEPGIRHAISNGSSVTGAGPQPWPFGDASIAAVPALLTAQAKRTASPPTIIAPVTATGKPTGTATVAS